MNQSLFRFLVALGINLILGLAILSSMTSDIMPGATSTTLIGRCELIRLDTRLQPQYTIVLACPRKDMIRLWPLPVQSPWFEDALDIHMKTDVLYLEYQPVICF
jgi:hypothetical protein